MKYIYIIIFYIFNFSFLISNTAVIINPVADAFENYLDNHDFDYAPEDNKRLCLRFHQLLFNEVIKVIKEVNNQVYCKFDSLFYFDKKNNLKNSLWINKSDLIYLKDIKKDSLDAVPKPYKYNNKVYKDNILTLIEPFYDIITKKHYSAGTRFVRAGKDNKNFYSIFLLDNNLNKIISYVNKDLAIVEYKNSINIFLKVLHNFSNNKSKIIPYLWGGCSYIDRFKDNDFYLKKLDSFGNKVWSRNNLKNSVKTGFECSSLILRAAQIAGMPYFAKNSKAIRKSLKPLKLNQKLENGDILWYKGHVLIISNIDKNLIMESVGYQLSYGKLHEVKLNKVFKNINNYKELLNLYFKNNKLIRLNKFGKVTKIIPKFLILKIKSIY